MIENPHFIYSEPAQWLDPFRFLQTPPASDPDLVHAISLATFHGEFATVVNTETILRSL